MDRSKVTITGSHSPNPQTGNPDNCLRNSTSIWICDFCSVSPQEIALRQRVSGGVAGKANAKASAVPMTG